ncbi:MAG TPA: site-2 protease family protein [Gammaproteobacteria bacterium]|nr:site-2 protease family protein [Gammaproteobacteria bacterium]
MEELSTLQKIAVSILPILFAITVHETAHGWVASRLGDSTAKMMGRLTLNPIKHIDLIGTVLIPILTIVTAGFIFGYAKPVPVNYQNLRHPKRDMALVALAGPVSNLLMALLWVIWIRLATFIPDQYLSASLFALATGVIGILINLVLMILNMLPLPPLDGGRVLIGVLPEPYSTVVGRIEPYGFIILILLLVMGVLGSIMWPAIIYFLAWFSDLAGLSVDQLRYILHVIGF